MLDKDTELVERARNGDLTAFKDLVKEYKRYIYYLAFDLTRCKEDAEDISQDVFLKAYSSLKHFRGDAKFSSWLYRITVNTCYSFKKKKSYTEMKTSEDIGNLIDSKSEMNQVGSINPERETESGFIRKHIEKALQKLPQRERTIFIMRNYSEMSFDEIVEILKIHPGTARSANHKALHKLRKELAFYKNEI